MKRNFCLSLTFLLVFIQGFTQTVEYRFRNIAPSNGLSQSSVIAIHQDKLGQMWFGTRDGLNRFDGANFKVFRNSPRDTSTISNSDILAIEEDSTGNIWIGTYNGLNCYNPIKNTFKKYFHTNNKGALSSNTIWCIKEINNEIWLGTSNGISIYNKNTGVFETVFQGSEHSEGLPSNFVLKIVQLKNGEIWIGTSKGLCKLINRANDKYVFKSFNNLNNKQEIEEDLYVQDILEDEDDNIWLATKNKGLFKYNRTNNTFISMFNEENDSDIEVDIRSLNVDKSGNLWIGTYGGVYVLNHKKELLGGSVRRIDNKNLIKIKSIYTDKKGSVWVGTYYGGVNIWDESNSNFTSINQNSGKNSLSVNVVSGMVADLDKNIYFGTEGGGITVVNTKGNAKYINRENTKNLPTDNIKTLLLVNEEDLWIGTIAHGLAVYNIKQQKITNKNVSAHLQNLLEGFGVYVIKKADDETFWLGTFGLGLIKYNTENYAYKIYSNGSNDGNAITNNRIRSLIVDSKKQIWVGTQSGLNLIKPSSLNNNSEEVVHFFFDNEALSGDDISTLFEDSTETIWASVKGKGFYRFNGEVFEKESLIDGEFEINSIHAIIEDSTGNLWLSSNHGIVKYNARSKETTIYTETDGLIGSEYNDNSSLAYTSNQFYFGGPAGVSYFDPEKIVTNTYAPQVILTDFKIQNKSVAVGNGKEAILTKSIEYKKHITLNYDKANFSITYAIPNFINAINNQYAYRLVGLEKEWITTSNNEANYTIQNPGTYIFEVKGANNNGIWNEVPTTIKITVNPAPWRSWWAFLVYALMITAALIVLILFLKSKDKLKLELALEHAENERNEEINQAKLQFFTNISHEFRTPLTLILGPLQQLLLNYKGSNQMHKKLLVIENSANHLLQLINRLMDFRKLENNQAKLHSAEGNIVKFLKEIYFSFSEFAKDGNYNYTFEALEDPILVYYDRSKLERVFYNLISNAFRFTESGGNIDLKVRKDEASIYISVEDNGVGISEEFIDKIFDRFFEIDIHNNPKEAYNKGTGIGLSIAKNIVTLHKGEINVKQNKEQGTIFEVVLPLGSAHLSEEEVLKDFKTSNDLQQYVTQLEVTPIDFEDDLEDVVIDENKQVVLIVEDDKPLRSFIKNLLKDEYTIMEAENGKVGFKKALKYIPDLIISDVMMPEMVGTEMCSQLKANLKTSHIPIVLLTARSSLIYKFEGLESGADEYISKPFNVKEFKLKVTNMLEAVKRIKNKFAKEDNLSPSQITVSSVDEELLKKAFKIVEDNISNEQFDIPFFCSELGVSRTMLFTKIKAWTNFTPNEFILEIRMKRAAQLLEQNKINISQVSYKVGFNNPKYFSKCFQKKYGETPSQYRNKFSEEV